MLEKIKKYYFLGIYKDKHIQRLLECNAITQDEFNELKEIKNG